MKSTLNLTKTFLALLLLLIACSGNESKANLEKTPRQKELENCIKKSFRKNDWKTFNKCRKEHKKLVKRISDSSAYAKNLFYTARYFEKRQQPNLDSAYYNYLNSTNIYKKLQDSSNIGKLLLNIAILQKNVYNYRISESISFEAINYLESGGNNEKIADVFNNLGLVYNELKDTLGSFEYHIRALNLRTEPKGVIRSLNNIGKAYKNFNQYDKAIQRFKEALLHETYLDKHPKIKATLIDNYGHALFKNGDIEQGYNLMKQALEIRHKERDLDGIAINNLHVSEYYTLNGDTLTALQYVEKAKTIAKKTKNYRDYKDALNVLSNLDNGKKSKEYHNRYKFIDDSLALVANNHRRRFERIKFEVEEKEKQHKRLIKNFIIFFIVVLLVGCSFYISKIRKKQKLAKAFAKGFRNYLIKKYNLSPENIDFWELWVTGLDQTQLAEQLFISVDAVKSRRKSLKKKIDVIQTIDGNFTQTKAIHIYNLEKDIFRNFN